MTSPNNGKQVRKTTTTRRTAAPQTTAATTSTAVRTESQDDEHIGQEAWIGTNSTEVSDGNVSWGAIFAGVVTFIAIMILLGVGAAAMGLQGSTGAATGIFAVIALVIAFAAAGYVSGALGVRAGLFHGLGTWATSLIATVILAGWLGASVLGGLGSILGTAATATGSAVGGAANAAGQYASENVTEQEARDAANQAENAINDARDQVTQEDIDNAKQRANEAWDDAKRTADEVSDDAAVGTWWTFAGLIIGAVVSALAGAAGSRSVLNRNQR